jgi:hypothetical protein
VQKFHLLLRKLAAEQGLAALALLHGIFHVLEALFNAIQTPVLLQHLIEQHRMYEVLRRVTRDV